MNKSILQKQPRLLYSAEYTQSLPLLASSMAADELFLSNNISEKDDGCTIILQLSSDDPLFYKKKGVLQNYGFDVWEQVQLGSSSCPDSSTTALEKMLQIARVIHLDEVELYFGDFDGLSMQYCSPRNEVEALNSILSLVKSLLTSKASKGMNVLQALQEAVLCRIEKCADDKRVESRIDESYSLHKENCLMEWGMSNGVKTSLQLAYIEGAGRGAIATEDRKVGDIAVEIPLSVIISEELVQKSGMYYILENIDGISSETMLLLWSMKERHNSDSKFKIYFDTLPKEFRTGLSFGVDAIMALDGTLLLEEIMQAKEHLRIQYDELIPGLCSNDPDLFPPEFYTWEQFLWACELWYSNSMKLMFRDGKLRTCLIPIAGFLNHSMYPHIVHYGKVDPVTNTLKFPLARPLHAGEQCCLSYGNFSSSHLITFYGFSLQGDNPYDVIPLDIDAGEDDSTMDSSMSSWSAHMLRGTWFSKTHNNIFEYGLPSPLLNCLRGAQNPILHKKHKNRSNLENEVQVLQDLHSTFSNMWENLGDSDPIECDNTNWDVKLALEFKSLQRRILSSILTSCDAGIKLLQDDFANLDELA